MGIQETSKLQMFEDQPIRTVWDEEREEWYFSVVDVIGALTESTDPAAYWRKLKQRLKAEGNETVTNCHGLKMKAADGKRRLTDVANTEQLLRLIQSIPSKKAEPFKLWLATVGRERQGCGERPERDRIPNRPPGHHLRQRPEYASGKLGRGDDRGRWRQRKRERLNYPERHRACYGHTRQDRK